MRPVGADHRVSVARRRIRQRDAHAVGGQPDVLGRHAVLNGSARQRAGKDVVERGSANDHKRLAERLDDALS